MIDGVMAASASRTAERGSARRHNLPVPLTSLVGRSRELAGIGETLRRTRLVTLTGPGGVGKTRLAIEVARRQIGRRAEGVWLIDLTAGPADPEPAAEVARTLEVGDRALSPCRQVLAGYRDTNLLPNALIGQAGLIARRDPASALRVAAAGWAIRVRGGAGFPPFFRERLEHVRAKCEAALGDETERIWSEGTRLAVHEAIALAFGASRPPAPAPAGLSARELEVVRLVADGMANKSIAAQLHLSVRTVESHVRHALAKAGLNNRTQLATWTREHIQ
jgi:DNA-binding CsgD family transcriptional regulator